MADSGTKDPESGKVVPTVKCLADIQRLRLEKLMKNPDKPVYIPEPPKEKKPPAPPEFIRNTWGSSAGAGSGDFHVYRGIRRREYARQKFIKEKAEKDEKNEAYKKKVEENQVAAASRTAKKRAKRLKKKAKLKKQKQGNKAGSDSSSSDEEDDDEEQDESGQQHDEAAASDKCRTVGEERCGRTEDEAVRSEESTVPHEDDGQRSGEDRDNSKRDDAHTNSRSSDDHGSSS